MKTVSTELANVINGQHARYYAKIEIDGIEIEENIDSISFTDIINSNNDISLGETCSKSISFNVRQPQTTLENKTVIIYEGVYVSESKIEYIKLGKFKITSAKGNNELMKYTAYDIMATDFEDAYFSKLAFPNTDINIIKEICASVGISFIQTGLTSHTIQTKPDGYTKREMIGYMASLQGKNAKINADGNLVFSWYSTSNFKIDADKIYQDGVTFDTSKTFKLLRLTCGVKTGDGSKDGQLLIGSSKAPGISFENPFMTQSILNNVYSKIKDFEFQPMTVKFLGDYRIETGDIVTVTKNGVDYNVPVMQIKHESDGGLISTIKAIAKSDTENPISVTGPNTKRQNRIYTELAVVNQALVNKLDVNVAEITYATIEELNTTEARIEELEASQITTDYLKSNYADIKLANIENGTIKSAMIETGAIGTTQIADGSITDAKIVGMTANKITAGKIDAAQIEVLNLNAANITVGTINGHQISSGAIDMDKLGSDVIEWQDNTTTNVDKALEDAGLANLTANNAQSTANTANDKIDNLEIGGRNLFIKNSNITVGKYLNDTGVLFNDTRWNITDYILVEERKEYIASGYTNLGNSSATCFYDSNKNFVSGIKNNNTTTGSVTEETLKKDKRRLVTVPIGCSYMKFSYEKKDTNTLKIEKGNKSTDYTEAPEDTEVKINAVQENLDTFSSIVTTNIDDLQSQIDGNITTWFYNYEPTISNKPAADWTTTELKNQHLGDLFYIIDDEQKSGQVYRWAIVSGLYQWIIVEDADVTKALADAAKAQDTADGKRRTFIEQPIPPYDVGDIWTQGTGGDIMICTTSRASGLYNSTDWKKASKYTDDTKANSALETANTANTNANSAVKELKNKKDKIYGKFHGKGQYNYCKVAKITTSEYCNNPLIIGINGRSYKDTSLTIKFKNSASNDPEIDTFSTTGWKEFWMVKSDTSEWLLIAALTEQWGELYVTNVISRNEYSSSSAPIIEILCEAAYETDIPSGSIKPVLLAAQYTVDNTTGGTNGSNSLITSGATNAGIQNAISIANGKTTSYYQTSAPSGGAYKVNDIWFDTDNGYKMHYWNGSEWKATEYGSSAISANAITSEKIAASSIIAGKISSGAVTTDKLAANSVVADKIASNAITTDKIKAGAITSTQIAASSISADRLAIGGDFTNLVTVNENYLNSAINSYVTSWHKAGAMISDGYIKKLSIDSPSIALTNYVPNVFIQGDTLYYKMSLKADEESSIKIIVFLGTTSAYKNAAIGEEHIISTTETEITGIVTIPELKTSTHYFIAIRDYTSTGQIYARNVSVKMQQGTTYIADGSITTDKIVASAITGDKIAANTITANNILANTITADKMNVTSLSSISANIGTITSGLIQSSNFNSIDGCQFNLTNGTFFSQNLSWTKTGTLSAKNANIKGIITAESGKIGSWEILSGGGLMAEKDTGTLPGTLNRMYLQPFLDSAYDDTWVISSQRWNIDSSGNMSDKGTAYWYITGGGYIYTEGQIKTKGLYPQIIGDGSVLELSYINATGTGTVIESGYLRPALDNTTIIGKSNKRYNAIYLVNSPNVTSDRNEKNTIDYLEDEEKKDFIKKFFSGLKPASYKLNSGTSGRTHYGLISNDIEDLLAKIGATSLDFAGFIKSPKTKDVVVEITDENGNVVYNENGTVKTETKEEIVEGEYTYALRYEEFIAPLIKMVQYQQKQIEKLEKEIFGNAE